MTLLRFVFQSLRFHARSHLGALLGAGVGSAVLIGALIVGDSVRGSLQEMALARLGKVDLALASNDRLFRNELAQDLVVHFDKTGSSSSANQVVASSVLQLPGTAANADGSARANRVQVLGVDEQFWNLANEKPAFGDLGNDGVLLNRTLAEQLKVKAGETVVLRVQKPSQLSRDAPLSPEEDTSVALRLKVAAVLSDAQFGRFSLQANQIPPFNAILPLAQFQKRVDAPNQANLLLLASTVKESGKSVDLKAATDAVRQAWKLADAELKVLSLSNRMVEVRSPRVFLDAPAAQAALNVQTNATGVLTYLVNELRIGDRATPYSMVTGIGGPIVPKEMQDNEILINQWLADDLQAKPGDELQLTYYVVQNMRKLEEQTTRFRVREILPMEGPAADSTLMPDFPGLTDADNCRDWDTGFAIKTDRIRDKDEKYWDQYRGTPKAFVTLAAGQKMWGNRFGNLTAIRYPAGTSGEAIASKILQTLDPASVSLSFQPVRAQALAASSPTQDFGQLFLGFSFFLIIAALLLMALMFQFGIEQRAGEVGTLLALGFTPKRVRRLLLLEGVGVALVGGLIGVAGGIWYAQSMLYGLSTIWREAVGTAALRYHAHPQTLVIGAIASTVVAVGTIWLALRKQAQQPARELLASGGGLESQPQISGSRRYSRGFWIGLVSGVTGLGLMIASIVKGQIEAGAFFGAGSLLLISGLGFLAFFLARLAGMGSHQESMASRAAQAPSLTGMGIRNTARRRKRSLATLGLLACGSFLIMSIGVFRLDSNAEVGKRASGTGGFAFIGDSSLPVAHDFNSNEGRSALGLDDKGLQGVQVVPFRVREGEDASCLNLNRAQKPRLLGVAPELLSDRNAFTFAKVAEAFPKENPWLLLRQRPADGSVPAIGDQASIQWALGKKIGDTLDYTDERGRTFKILLVASVANSILQGNLIIAEDQFIAKFPNESGYRMFLMDAPSNQLEEISKALTRALQDVGMELTLASQRLAAFNAVQNTYLSTFQVLGGLGLLLGSVGLGVVVLRNVLERRAELALLLAVGFRPRALKWLVMSEHGALLLLGLGAGVLAAIVAVVPAVLSPGAEVPYTSLALTLGAVGLSGIIWTWLATRFALRGKLLDALRNN